MIKLIGYGNSARGDDGLGPAFAAWAADSAFPGVDVRTAFQLNVDDALWIQGARRVVFVDAALPSGEGYRFRTVQADPGAELSTHAASPGAVLALSKTLYGSAPEAFVLEITGDVFGDIREGLSPVAVSNLKAAQSHFEAWIKRETAPAAP